MHGHYINILKNTKINNDLVFSNNITIFAQNCMKQLSIIVLVYNIEKYRHLN